LYNRSNKTFNLKNCLYYYGTTSYKLPDAEIKPDEYFVLTKTTAVANFPEGIKVFGVTSFPTLANTGRLLMFGLDNGTLISWFEYADSMYGSNEKKSGGWSLECIDLENKSNKASNWTGSDIAGGTPGRINSVKRVNQDSEIPVITGIQTLVNNEVRLTFSKPMNRKTLTDKSSYTLNNNSYEIKTLTPNYPQATEIILLFNTLPPQGVMIELELTGIKDRSGFGLDNKKVLLGSGYEATENEIVINEILFNPPTGGNEYVEIYNKSNKAFDLRFLSITSRKPSDGSLNSLYKLATTPLLLQPQEYLVITKNKDLVCSFFECRPSSSFVELSIMPSLANTSGCAVLINNLTNEIIDEFAYNEKMHTANISNKKGISLERLDFNRLASDQGNWHSASESCGFGTPGYQNSQYNPNTGIDEGIIINSIEELEKYGFLVEKISCDSNFKLLKSPNVIYVDTKKLIFPLTIRNWKKGDYFYPFGMKTKKKLSDFFTDLKVDLLEKQKIRLLCSGNQIVWIINYRADDRFRIDEKTEFCYSLTT